MELVVQGAGRARWTALIDETEKTLAILTQLIGETDRLFAIEDDHREEVFKSANISEQGTASDQAYRSQSGREKGSKI
jgi:hypothetical protein